MYGDLLREGETEEEGDVLAQLNPDSLEVVRGVKVEPSVVDARVGEAVQFERTGYFCADPDGGAGRLVFNRTVELRSRYKP